jgi:hypothetical protein
MKKIILLSLLFATVLSCDFTKEPVTVPIYDRISGYVIGKEICHTDTTQDYWLIDFTDSNNSPQIGDTLFLNGITYTNVLKVKGLDEGLGEIGRHILIEYDTVTPDAVISTGCNVSSAVTYSLKEVFIIYQYYLI